MYSTPPASMQVCVAPVQEQHHGPRPRAGREGDRALERLGEARRGPVELRDRERDLARLVLDHVDAELAGLEWVGDLGGRGSDRGSPPTRATQASATETHRRRDRPVPSPSTGPHYYRRGIFRLEALRRRSPTGGGGPAPLLVGGSVIAARPSLLLRARGAAARSRRVGRRSALHQLGYHSHPRSRTRGSNSCRGTAKARKRAADGIRTHDLLHGNYLAALRGVTAVRHLSL